MVVIVMREPEINDNDLRKRILTGLSYEWISTTGLAKDVGVNWYRVEDVLRQMLTEGIIEKMELTGGFYWRLKGVKNE